MVVLYTLSCFVLWVSQVFRELLMIRCIMLVESNTLLRLILDIEGRRLMLLKVI